MKESVFQKHIKNRLKSSFPGVIIYKTDPQQIQGSPDLIILHKDKWAALEIKKDEKARCRPNQRYRVQQMNDMSYAAFVYPENEEEVFHDLERLFQT